MSKVVTEDDIPVGYSSEPDDEYEEFEKNAPVSNDTSELYVGNTGKVSASKFYNLFRSYGHITDMNIWRSHNHLYHARIIYKQGLPVARKVITELNGKFYNGKRLRLTLVKDKVALNFPAALRIDDICAGCTEEDIYEHFSQCGVILFVIKIGLSAYVQFKLDSSASTAMMLEMILNGDPYTITRIAHDDRVDHIQLLENMKQIKHRKPFVMVENFPRLGPEVPLHHYKACFEKVGLVEHFKIAPTGTETVTLALAMAKSKDRIVVIEKFNNSMKDNNLLKLYMVPGRAVMTIHHATMFASAKATIVVSGLPPFYKDYDVCMLFKKCGEINFLEKFDGKWLIAFENQSAVSLANFYHFMINRQRLVIHSLTPETVPGNTTVQLRDYEEPETKEPNTNASSRTNQADEFLLNAMRSMDEQIKMNPGTQQQKNGNASIARPGQTTNKPVLPKTPNTSNSTVIMPHSQNALKRSAEPVKSSANEQTQLSSDEVEETTGRILHRLSTSIYIGNLAKGLTENDLCELFEGKELANVLLYCSRDSYYPSAVGYVEFVQRADYKYAIDHNHDRYRGKRVTILRCRGKEGFTPEQGFMVKNLTSNISEEGLWEEIEKVLGPNTVDDIIKPAHHYAYASLRKGISLDEAVNQLREAFVRFKIDVYPLYLKVPKRLIPIGPSPETVETIRRLEGQKTPSEMEIPADTQNANKLFIGNIPRDAAAEDVIDYFNNFGNVIDYSPIEKKSCYLRKSAIISFSNSDHAQNAYRRVGHFFEGCKLIVHPMEYPPYQYKDETPILTVKSHSPFLTCDEVFNALAPHLRGMRVMRFDADDDRANFIVKYFETTDEKSLPNLLQLQFINDEAVVILDGFDLTPPTDDEARESRKISDSLTRRLKENLLSYIVHKENIKEDMEIDTRQSREQDVPFGSFYNDNAIQVNNVSLDTTLENIRDLFYKCGNIIDYRGLILEDDNSKICYVKFDTDLAADLACTYNQRLVNGKRILVHLCKETVRVERNRSILVERLNPQNTAEQVYEALSGLGMIKYVHKQTPFTAIVCFKDQDSKEEAISTRQSVKYGPFVIDHLYEDYDPRFFRNFTATEEFIALDVLRSILKPLVRPEYHQSLIERQVFESLPEDVKRLLISELRMARETLPDFDNLTKPQQIFTLKTKYKKFTQREYFINLAAQEQDKLLDMIKNSDEDVTKTIDTQPPLAKQARNEEPNNDQPDKTDTTIKTSEKQSLPNPTITPSTVRHVTPALATTGMIAYPSSNPIRYGHPMNVPINRIGPGINYPNVVYRSNIVNPMQMTMVRGQSGTNWPQQVASMAYNAQIRPVMAYNSWPRPGMMNPNRPPFFR
ncbi:uncharacterized protein LOC131440220 [Malaya genurostris]|uniref:uncharacterized protein LOC131440220 n=1 Tax=Malaya genurostris TaxID=325434 RepID=UPI0026F4015A|nr:uncharacterized protein LOC131440220 [Malaya genurostris]